MRNIQRQGAAALLISFLTLGFFGTLPQAARADDVPIIIHKPIIVKDPPKHPKKDSETMAATAFSPSMGTSR